MTNNASNFVKNYFPHITHKVVNIVFINNTQVLKVAHLKSFRSIIEYLKTLPKNVFKIFAPSLRSNLKKKVIYF
jgi:bisphosphoglycerate-dependent phosphoglycerate mutase